MEAERGGPSVNMHAMFLSAALVLAMGPADDRQTVIVVVGAPGADQYSEQFRLWAGRWEQTAQRAGAKFLSLGQGGEAAADDRDTLQKTLAEEQSASAEPLWLVLIGHGTFDGRHAKFNLRGPDVSAEELADWLKPCRRPLAVINCASASGPFINQLSGPGRVIVTATKSGFEHNYARLGDYLSSALSDAKADLDKDEQVSLLEAFLSASAKVQEYYDQDARLATEHALIDDNGDGLGTPGTWFRGVRATRTAKEGASPDGLRANQFFLVRSDRERNMAAHVRARRDELELEIARLRQAKDRLDEQDYDDRLEAVLVELARLYEQCEQPDK